MDESPQPKIRRKSSMWTYFTQQSDQQVKCNLCNREYKYSNNTSNLKDHIKRKHPEKLVEPSTSSSDAVEGELQIGNDSDIITAAKSSSSGKYHINSSRKKYLDTVFVKMIALDMEPLRLSERQGLKEFVKALDSRYEMPSRTIIADKYLPRLHNSMKAELIEILDKVTNIAVTTDMWTSISNKSICAVTCHFILRNELHSCLLEAAEVEGSHDANTISAVLDRILEEWKCRQKVIAVVTDNAAVMIKMADILKIRHIPCFAHSLNLVIKSVLTEPALSELMSKCKQIVAFFKHSSIASDQLTDNQKRINKPVLKLKQQIDTRWNSALLMIRRIREVREELTIVLNQNPRAPTNLTADEYSLLQEIEQIFDPIETCTVAVSGEKYSTISLILPLIKGLGLQLSHLERQNLSDSAIVILQHVRTAINKYLKPYDTRSACIISTLLNPHFKKLGFKTDSDVEKAVSCVQREYAFFVRSQNSVTSTMEPLSAPVSEQETAMKKSKLSNLLSYLTEPGSSRSVSTTSDAIIDIRRYLEKPIIPSTEYPIEYWAYSENNLKHIGLKYLCIPATSTPSERIFSKAGQIMTERRNRLSGKNMNAILFINQNNYLLGKK